MFTDNGFWDTFRAVFPFFNLMFPSLNAQIMEGSNSASIIADAYLKGGKGFDINKLYQALLKNSENEGPLSSVG
eukprot:gene48078-58893_t